MLNRKVFLGFACFYVIILFHSIFSISLYANEPGVGVMQIEAKILCPAEVVVLDDMDFGKVLSGTRKNTARGKFRIRHDEEEDVQVTYSGIELVGENTGKVFIRNTKTNNTLPVSIVIRRGENKRATDKSEREEFFIDLTGELNVPSETPSGIYEAELIATVTYN